MLKKYIYGVIALALYACNNHEVVTPHVDVTTSKNTYKVNDTIEFKFSGESDIVTFYSGEDGKDYRHKDRTRLENVDIFINHDTQVLYGSQSNNLKLFISQDFTEDYTAEGIDAATWVDVSDRIQWGLTNGTGAGVRLKSSSVRIQDLVKDETKPIYFAYRYTGFASTSGSAQQRTWRIYEFNVINNFEDKGLLVTNRAGAGWKAVNYNASLKGKWELTTNATMIYYNPESNLLPAEQWAISKAIDAYGVDPDKGVGIKTYADNMLKSYKYAFSKPGKYNVSFVFKNQNFNGLKEEVKSIEIEVEP